MKTIVISGASSGVGKTSLAAALGDVLENSVAVKIGHHKAKTDRPYPLYPMGTGIDVLHKKYPDAGFLVIESNSILHRLEPDLCIYLDGVEEKPSAALARQRAHLRRGEPCTRDDVAAIASRLAVPDTTVRRIAWLAGARPEPFSIAILAGGRSSRMGRDKAFLNLDGQTAIDRLLLLLEKQCDHLLVSTHARRKPLFGPHHVVVDREEGKGPLAGIGAVLRESTSDVIGITACDIPWIAPNFFPTLCAWLDGADAAVPTFDGKRVEPTMSVFRKTALPHIEAALAGEDLRITGALKRCRSVIISFTDADWYYNLNTPEDLARYEKKSGNGSAGRLP
jgi:molybdopterin-guanine dinucleotide biosynthesis protein A